jgi:hypothetical protein
MAGEEITFDLINPMGGKPIMGARMAEGRGRSDELLAGPPAHQPGALPDQRRRHDDAAAHRARAAQAWLAPWARATWTACRDQLILMHLAGARGFHTTSSGPCRWPADRTSPTILVNQLQAPTKNRHYMSTGSGIESVNATAGNELNFATTDVLNMDVVDAIRTLVDSMPLPPRR